MSRFFRWCFARTKFVWICATNIPFLGQDSLFEDILRLFQFRVEFLEFRAADCGARTSPWSKYVVSEQIQYQPNSQWGRGKNKIPLIQVQTKHQTHSDNISGPQVCPSFVGTPKSPIILRYVPPSLLVVLEQLQLVVGVAARLHVRFGQRRSPRHT